MKPLEAELILNRAARGYDRPGQVERWFHELDPADQQRVLILLWRMAQQAGWREDSTHDDTTSAVMQADLGPADPVRQVVAGRPTDEMLERVAQTPPAVWSRLFAVLLRVLALADTRRRGTRCATGCSHWWHQDLDDPELLDKVTAAAQDRHL